MDLQLQVFDLPDVQSLHTVRGAIGPDCKDQGRHRITLVSQCWPEIKYSYFDNMCRLHQQFQSDEAGSITIDQLLPESLQAVLVITLVKVLKWTFPSIKQASKRRTDNWVKKQCVYKGISKRQATQETVCSFPDLPSQVPKDFFVMNNCENNVTIGFNTGMTSYMHTVITTIKVYRSGTLETVVGMKQMGNESVGLPDNVTMTQEWFGALFTVVRNLRYCEGVTLNKENNPTGKDCSVILPITSSIKTKTCKQCKIKEKTKTTKATNPDNDYSESSKSFAKTNKPLTRDEILSKIKESVPDITDTSLKMIESQLRNTSTPLAGRRWDDDITSVCMHIWSKSPKAYEEIIASGALVLPSILFVSLLNV